MSRQPTVTDFMVGEDVFDQTLYRDPLNHKERQAMMFIALTPMIAPKDVGDRIEPTRTS